MSGSASRIRRGPIVLAGVILLAAVGWMTQGFWTSAAAKSLAALRSYVLGPRASSNGSEPGKAAHSAHDEHEHSGHNHAGHSDANSLELSEQAQKNIGLTVGRVKLGTYVKTVTIPGIVVERRGWTKTRIVSPLTGIVTKVYAIEGEVVRAGQPLFDLRLTHEDLVQSQVEFLKSLGELDVVNREVARLEPLVEKGALPQKTLLDRQYEQQKLEAMLRAQTESLLLHGLSPAQVEEIKKLRALRSSLTVSVPDVRRETATESGESKPQKSPLYVVEEPGVENGRLVTAGDALLTLSDYAELYIEGNAFEQDAQLVADALKENWRVTAIVENHTPAGTMVPDLAILYLSDRVDPASRTLHFYVALKNELVRDVTTSGHRFVNWRYKPGQRTHLRVPVEEWSDRIVLPAQAVATDGPETFVFVQNGDHFDRLAVQLEYRDLVSAVIAQDGTLFPGDAVALSGAQQMLMALKNKGGGGIDPHAGHTH